MVREYKAGLEASAKRPPRPRYLAARGGQVSASFFETACNILFPNPGTSKLVVDVVKPTE